MTLGRARRWLVDVAIVWLVAALPAVAERAAGRVPTASDLGTLFLPNWAWWWSDAQSGGWNPWIFGGHPANADPLTSRLHPFALFYAAFEPETAAAIEAWFLQATAAMGMLTYLRVIGCGRVAALIGALSFGLGGYTAANAVHPPHLRSSIAIPWALAAIEALSGPALVAGLGSAFAWILLGGHPQTIAYCAGILALYGLCVGRPTKRGRLPAMMGAAAVGLLVGGAVWLPALEFIFQTTRVAITPPFPDPHLTPGEWYWLFSPLQSWFHSGGAATAFGGGLQCGPIECGGYPGLVVWVAFAAGLPLVVRDRRGLFWAAMVPFSFLLAGGLLPLPSGVRGPARAILWLDVALAAAAGLGVERLLDIERSSPAKRRSSLAIASVVVTSMAIVAAGQRPWSWPAFLLTGCTVVAAAVSLSSRRPTVAVAVLVGELFAFQHLVVPFGESPETNDGQRVPVAIAREVVARSGDEATRVLLLPAPEAANWASTEKVELIQGYNLLVSQWFAALLGQRTELGLDAIGSITDPSLARPESHVLDLLRVAYVMIDPAHPSHPLAAAIREQADRGDRWERLSGDPHGYHVYRNRRARPPAWLVGRTRPTPTDHGLALLRGEGGSGFSPEIEALVERDLALETPDGSTSVTTAERSADEWTLIVETTGNALLVTSERASVGWTVTIDGTEVGIERVNGGFRGVVVPAGRSVVRFRYAPPMNRLGHGIGMFGMLGILLCAALASRRADGSEPPATAPRSASW